MQVTDPKPFLEALDMDFIRDILGRRAHDNELVRQPDPPTYSEPPGGDLGEENSNENSDNNASTVSLSKVLEGRVLVLGDFIDTDAVSSPSFSSCRALHL